MIRLGVDHHSTGGWIVIRLGVDRAGTAYAAYIACTAYTAYAAYAAYAA